MKEPSGLPGGETAEDEVEDDEFARIMSRLNELEMQEEQEGEDGNGRGEKHDSPIESELDTVKGIRGETNKKQETALPVPKNASGDSYSSSIREPKISEVSSKLISHLRSCLWLMVSYQCLISFIPAKSQKQSY